MSVDEYVNRTEIRPMLWFSSRLSLLCYTCQSHKHPPRLSFFINCQNSVFRQASETLKISDIDQMRPLHGVSKLMSRHFTSPRSKCQDCCFTLGGLADYMLISLCAAVQLRLLWKCGGFTYSLKASF